MGVVIHSTAVVDPQAEIDDGVVIGPFCVLGAKVKIGAGTHLHSHVVVSGETTLGNDNQVFPFAAIGGAPQDKKYAGENTRLIIGDNNTIREHCTISLGTVQDQGLTQIGSNNLFMATVHIAHDCVLGNDIVLANGVHLAGHVVIADWVVMGGFSGAHQFVKIGEHVMIGAHTKVTQDVPDFILYDGQPPVPHGINVLGLRRRDFSNNQIRALQQAYKTLYRENLGANEAVAVIRAEAEKDAEAASRLLQLANFVEHSQRGIVRP